MSVCRWKIIILLYHTILYCCGVMCERSGLSINFHQISDLSSSLCPSTHLVEINCSLNDSEKPVNNENKSSSGTSLFQNIKSGGGQAIKVFSSFAASSLLRPSESDINTKQSQIDDLAAPLPPFIEKVGYVRDNDRLNCYNLRDSWGFPLGIFDEVVFQFHLHCHNLSLTFIIDLLYHIIQLLQHEYVTVGWTRTVLISFINYCFLNWVLYYS